MYKRQVTVQVATTQDHVRTTTEHVPVARVAQDAPPAAATAARAAAITVDLQRALRRPFFLVPKAVDPVSYTHLDVYKRQATYSPSTTASSAHALNRVRLSRVTRHRARPRCGATEVERIVCFGEALIDFSPAPGLQPDQPRMFVQHAGGAPANVAVAVARLGGQSEFVGMLGADMFGDFLLDSLRDAGVEVRHVQRTGDAPTALAFVALDAQGERSFSFYRPPAADLLFRDADPVSYTHLDVYKRQGPYIGLGIALFVLAVIVWLFRLPPLREASASESNTTHRLADVLRFRHVRYGVAAIFLYVGAEVAIGSFLINYLSMHSIGGVSESAAANYVAFYWGGAMVGRFIGSALMRHVDPRLLLGIFASSTVTLLLVTMASSGQVALWSVVAIGLFLSLIHI